MCETLQARVCGRKIPKCPSFLPCPVTTVLYSNMHDDAPAFVISSPLDEAVDYKGNQ